MDRRRMQFWVLHKRTHARCVGFSFSQVYPTISAHGANGRYRNRCTPLVGILTSLSSSYHVARLLAFRASIVQHAAAQHGHDMLSWLGETADRRRTGRLAQNQAGANLYFMSCAASSFTRRPDFNFHRSWRQNVAPWCHPRPKVAEAKLPTSQLPSASQLSKVGIPTCDHM